MDLLKQTKKLCRLYGLKPARSKGQSFLVREEIYNQIIKTAGLDKKDMVLEIGPGLGFLTAKLAQEAGKVIAVELDDKLADILTIAIKAQNINNVSLINEDILKLNLDSAGLKDREYKIVANLPYNITSIFLRNFLSGPIKPKTMVLMLQKEVAERIVSRAGEMSLLAVSIQFYARSKIIGVVGKDNFWPVPAVDSAIIKIEIKDKLPEVDVKKFFRLVKFGFSAKRKMLKNNLVAGFRIPGKEAENILEKAELNLKTRAEDLSLVDWVKLANFFKDF